MSDFFSSGWHWFIAAVSVAGLAFCIWLLFTSSKTTHMSDDGTTGHVWDEDLREMNNPLPRWWLGLFVITVVFSAIYLYLYPGLGQAEGSLKWSSEGQHQAEVDAAKAKTAPLYQRLAAMDAKALAADAEAMGIGQRLFLNNCATCHGSDAKGSKGFPNLTDGDWLWGGEFETIKQTITEGRIGQMPPMAAAVGTGEDQRNVAHYVLSLSGSAHDNLRAQLGKEKFAACAACHGSKGDGNTALGAPRLNDKIWLHGWGEQAIMAMIANGKHNQMPAQKATLAPEQIHVLAGYVWSLSNGGKR
ncbi:cytochrome-c oxidase, cbb3-type subunit III [Inhella proteolytica]|uniref:Cbb3-type cytochrome c oxidase subunit n=1 Tax=Inhella proteolytica TaxID=2795029 RepID=A0A931J2U7_9BURK|nr:cytochrome-c oxidase, cbb3-type subunit III [Inhella proteolytica]MBH9578544.1 cytochrome-c oxidase, cbb3-type subunit III [Inhella proteolytica]